MSSTHSAHTTPAAPTTGEVEQIAPGIYRIGVPLPGNPLRMTNTWLVMGGPRHLLIDNGFNMPECFEALMAGLGSLNVPLNSLDCFLTHTHTDHTGLTHCLAVAPEARIFTSAGDGAAMNHAVNNERHWRDLFHSMLPHGFSQGDIDRLLSAHPAKIYAPPQALNFTPVGEGDVLEYGAYKLRVLSVPGHTPDHVALLDEERGLFFAGDHILGRITPNIAPWASMPNPLGSYLKSLDRTRGLPIRLTLPGHRAVIEDTRARIDELKAHHAARLDEVRGILRTGGQMSASAVARRMSWNLRYPDWDAFPVQQRWFATGEGLSHLRHLHAIGEVSLHTGADGSISFALAE